VGETRLPTLIPGEFPFVRLRAPDGAQAEIYLHGGHLTSWTTPDGRERLYMSERATFRPGASLRGGVPVIFPQFAQRGPLIKHGFARIHEWGYVADELSASAATAHVRLRDSDATRGFWEYAFQLDLWVSVGGPDLRVAFEVTNTDARPFTFTGALHTYLRVSAIEDVTVDGLAGRPFTEFGADAAQAEALLRVRGELDRIYWDAPGPITVRDPEQALRVSAAGFSDVVVWNPGPVLADALADMEPGGYRHMLCVEAAVIGRPVTLAPGATWRGAQALAAT